MTRDLVILCDGTENQLNGDETNVLRLFRMLVRDSQQIVYYDSGVGTTPTADRVTLRANQVRKKLDAAVGLSIRHHFLKAYRFLLSHYEPGDRIWLFGFSRGAYTARAVAGALHAFGLLRRELVGLEDVLWEDYSGTSPDDDSSAKKFFTASWRFRNDFAQLVPDAEEAGRLPIHFCGVWDTVSAFGWVTQMRSLYYTAQNPSVRHVRHAVSIDERRSMFQPNLWLAKPATGGTDPVPLKQVWFAGVHSDVGGGYSDTESGLAKIALEWMVAEAESCGLRFDTAKRQAVFTPPKPTIRTYNKFYDKHESLEKFWHAIELVPQRRFNNRHEDFGLKAPNLWRSRAVVDLDQESAVCPPTLHQSVLDRLKKSQCRYSPNNLPEDYQVEPWSANSVFKTHFANF
jgi:uncharacterized protein (DUF2235 family)